MNLWGSFETLLSDLSGPVRNLLDSFLPPTSHHNGDYGAGYAIRDDGYLALTDLANALGADEGAARDVVDRLLKIRVLRRGLLLNCERCHWEAFYRIEHVGSSFTCAACEHSSLLKQERWYKADTEPAWYYSLDQVVRDLLRQHGDVPLLAANKLREGSSSFLWSPELTVKTQRRPAEIDLCLIIDGRIVVGEAKSNGNLSVGGGTSRPAAKLAGAAEILTADEIVLATSVPAWVPGTRPAVEKAVADRWTRGPLPKITELVNVGA
jgi:hypothetical protein